MKAFDLFQYFLSNRKITSEHEHWMDLFDVIPEVKKAEVSNVFSLRCLFPKLIKPRGWRALVVRYILSTDDRYLWITKTLLNAGEPLWKWFNVVIRINQDISFCFFHSAMPS